jgi:hypothetical protein
MEILGIVDLILASYAINIAMHNEPNMMIMFAFEVRIFVIIEFFFYIFIILSYIITFSIPFLPQRYCPLLSSIY